VKTVTVKVEKLLAKLRANHDAHVTIFSEAWQRYRALCIKTLRANLEAAEKGGEIAHVIRHPVPENHADDYLTAINMLEWHEEAGEAFIEISQDDFRTYVEDEWGWQRAWDVSTRSYLEG
jgi:capsule polysaccharide modification protein KpsS